MGSFSPFFFPIPSSFPRRATLFLLKREPKSFNDLAVSHIDKKWVSLIRLWSSRQTKKVRLRPPFCLVFANLRLPGNFTGGLREVKTSRNLPGKLPGKLTGSKITGVSRNTRKVYGSLTGDLPGPIIYRVFRETGPWTRA